MMMLVVSKYGAFYLCESLVKEGVWTNCTNTWMVSRRKSGNKFYASCGVRNNCVYNIIRNVNFDETATHSEIYNFLKDKGLVKDMLKRRIEGE